MPRTDKPFNPFGKKKRKAPSLPEGYNPFAIYSPYASQVTNYTPVPESFVAPRPANFPYTYTTPAVPTTPGYQGAYGGQAQTQVNPVMTPPTPGQPYTGEWGKWYSAGGQGRGGPGWFGGVPGVNRAGEDITYGYGWGNQNVVVNWGSEEQPYYTPSEFGRRTYGLSDENVDKGTGELTGALNRFGQPLGTNAPVMGRSSSKWRWHAPKLSDEEIYRRNAEQGKPGPLLKWQRARAKKRAEARSGNDVIGEPVPTPTTTPNWYNDLINWNI